MVRGPGVSASQVVDFNPANLPRNEFAKSSYIVEGLLNTSSVRRSGSFSADRSLGQWRSMASIQVSILVSILVCWPAAACACPLVAYQQQNDSKNDIKKIIETLRRNKNNSENSGNRPARRSAPRDQPKVEASRMGALRIVTEAPEAEVIIRSRGEITEQGPCENGVFQIELAAGEYEVEITSARIVVFTAKARVKPAATETVRAPMPPTGSIIVDFQYLDDIDPEEVTVLIDGQQVSSPRKISEGEEKTRIRISGIPVGAHRIRFSHPAMREIEQSIDVISGATSINPAFEKTKGRLFVKSEPGASIFVDGALQGAVTEIGVSEAIYLAPGRHRIRVEKQGYTASEMDRLFDQSDLLIELKLTKKAGRAQGRASG